MLAYALTIFTGAFLLFQVQPLIGKFILPWFGGGPGVWTTCMLFFQLLLLGGYAYAHFSSRHLKPRTQAVVHLVLLAAALAMLPITPSENWKPKVAGDPTWHILALLTVSLGLPYLVLSTTGPLMQEWFRRMNPGVSPYRLYSLSNIGSLLALISYPFYFETHFTRQAQTRMWSGGLALYALFCAYCAWRLWKQPPAAEAAARAADAADVPAPRWGTRLMWLLLPACASVMLVAITNKLCQDVAVIPFLWVLPLALYLVTFIICFDNPRWYSRFYFTIALVVALVDICIALYQGTDMAILKQVFIYTGGLFVACMVCHGELYQLKPHPKFLTSYYLMISAGGALGGILVAVVAPLVFAGYYELHWSMGVVLLLLLLLCFKGRDSLTPLRWRILYSLLLFGILVGLDRGYLAALDWLKDNYAAVKLPIAATWNYTTLAKYHWALWGIFLLYVAVELARRRFLRPRNWHLLTCSLLMVGVYALAIALYIQVRVSLRDSVSCARNFYGVLAVFEYRKDSPDNHYFLLQHGKITHGLQFAAPSESTMLTTYYGEGSGVGLAIRNFPRQEGMRIGLVGLGTGTVSAYGKPGDYVRIYEINPYVKELAESRFTYLKNSQAKVDVALGDARLSMEQEPSQQFDVLALDAFSSDAIPVHLLTREAVEIYQRHLKPDGVLAVHISNRYLDLEPVVENIAREFKLKTAVISNDDNDDNWWIYSSTWVLLTRNTELLEKSAISLAASTKDRSTNTVPMWTDDYASLFQILQK
jgi:SAM-dependent methyltransferase